MYDDAFACRIACVQFSPAPGQVRDNVEKVKQLTKNLSPGSIDLLVLPEMALTGYVFSGKDEIRPLLEDPFYHDDEKARRDPFSSPSPSSSPSLHLARDLAIRLHCFVIIGFPLLTTAPTTTDIPESYLDRISSVTTAYDARPSSLVKEKHDDDTNEDTLYNAALLVDERGTLLHVFRKHFNYEDDKRWAQEGPGFQTITLPKLGKVCVAICMDLNPYDFSAAFDAFELAQYCKREGVDVLVMPMAWLLTALSDSEEAGGAMDDLHEGPSADTINYWATRLSPFLIKESVISNGNGNGNTATTTTTNQQKDDFFFITCNRTGTEKKSKFAGSSCALHFKQKGVADVELIAAMSRKEGVQVMELLRTSHVMKRV